MNFLDVIKQAQIKRNRVWEAKLMHLKAYRGVPYEKAETISVLTKKTYIYRGKTYVA